MKLAICVGVTFGMTLGVCFPSAFAGSIDPGAVPIPRPKALRPAVETAQTVPAVGQGETGALIVDLESLANVTAETAAVGGFDAQAEAVSNGVRSKEKEGVDFGPAVTVRAGSQAELGTLAPITINNQIAPGSAQPMTDISLGYN